MKENTQAVTGEGNAPRWQGMTSPSTNSLNTRLIEALKETCDLLDHNEVEIPVRVLRIMSENGLSVELKKATEYSNREEVEAQRDELLAALREIAEVAYADETQYVRIARAAITKAEGSK